MTATTNTNIIKLTPKEQRAIRINILQFAAEHQYNIKDIKGSKPTDTDYIAIEIPVYKITPSDNILTLPQGV